MKVVKAPRKLLSFLAIAGASAAFAFLASMVFDINALGCVILFFVILLINIVVGYCSKSEKR